MRYILLFFLSFAIFPFSSALELEVDFIRTPGENGIFLFTVWPTNTTSSDSPQDYFVRSYPSTSHPVYRPILDIIRSGGGVVVSPNQLKEVPVGARVTTLGSTKCNTEFCFKVSDPNKAEEEFIAFAERSLPLKINDSLRATWGPGVSDVHKLEDSALALGGISWVGRFTDETDSSVAVMSDSGHSFVFPLSKLGSVTYQEIDIERLNEQWRVAHYGDNKFLLWFLAAWPWILSGLFLGILLIGFIVTRLRRTENSYSSVSLDACMDEVPMNHLDEIPH